MSTTNTPIAAYCADVAASVTAADMPKFRSCWPSKEGQTCATCRDIDQCWIETKPEPSAPMSEFTVENFVDQDTMAISASKPHGSVPATVRFMASHGDFLWSTSILPNTARAMAGALMILADTAEQYEFEATVQAELAAELAAA